MSGYQDCGCCGNVTIDSDLCDCCEAAGCDASENDCQIPQCHEDGCDTRATWGTDEKWHSNCEGPCPNEGKSWEDEQARTRTREAYKAQHGVEKV